MADDRQLLTDLRLALRNAALRPVYAVATEGRRVSTGQDRPRTLHDIGTVGGRGNLEQAIILRLLTPRGELAALGHPHYGSRLHQVVGRLNNEGTRNLIKLFILESLQQEPRIREVVEVAATPHPVHRNRVDVRLSVLPIGDTRTVEIGPFTIEL